MINNLRNIYIYGCFHIAICTVLLLLHSFVIFNTPISYPYLLFVFFGVLTIYNGHRLVSKSRLNSQTFLGRYTIIDRFEIYIWIIISVSAIATAICYFTLENNDLKCSIIPLGILSLIYIFPALGKGRRLRDFPFIKIFIIALVYSVICHLLPITFFALKEININLLLSTLGYFLFIFSITIPFDIRDHDFDKAQNTETLVNKFGFHTAKKLGFSCICICTLIAIYLWYLEFYELNIAISLLATYLISLLLTWNANTSRDDHYFSFWLDGTMALPYLFYLLLP